MKKTFLAAAFCLSFSMLFANDLTPNKSNLNLTSIVNLSKPIDLTVRSSNGCMVHIVGNFSYSITPASITSFTGSVTITGGTNSPNGTMGFSIGGKVMSVNLDNQDVRNIRSIKWTGNPMSAQYVAILNEAGVINALTALIHTLG